MEQGVTAGSYWPGAALWEAIRKAATRPPGGFCHGQLSSEMLNAYNRPQTVIRSVAQKQSFSASYGFGARFSRVTLLTPYLILDEIAVDMPESVAISPIEPVQTLGVMRQAPKLGRKTVSLKQS